MDNDTNEKTHFAELFQNEVINMNYDGDSFFLLFTAIVTV